MNAAAIGDLADDIKMIVNRHIRARFGDKGAGSITAYEEPARGKIAQYVMHGHPGDTEGFRQDRF